MTNSKGPLEGVRILDITRNTAGLYCGMILADLGAETILIESPKTHEKATGPRLVIRKLNGVDARFIHLCRNRKGMALDLWSLEGRGVFCDLAAKSDVVIDNYRPGIMEKIGIHYEKLKEINPRIISCSITGFGFKGPYRDRASLEVIGQAMSGLTSLFGELGKPPVIPNVPISDLVTPLFATHGVLAALYHRERTGLGQKVTTSQLDATMSLLAFEATHYLNTGIVPQATGSRFRGIPLFGAFPTKDSYIILGCALEPHVLALFRVLGMEDILQNPRFSSHVKRLENWIELNSITEGILQTKTTAEWLEPLLKENLPAASINTLDKVFSDPHVQQGDMVATVQYERKDYKLLANPIRFSAHKLAYEGPPTLGQHTEEILQHLLGYTQEKIDKLREQKEIA